MLKKIVLAVALIALPALGAMAQQKFAHVNAQAIIVEMAEYKKAVSDIEAMQKNYQDELQRTQEEFNKKYSLKAADTYYQDVEVDNAIKQE